MQLYNQDRNYAEHAKSIIASSPEMPNAPEGYGDAFIQMSNSDILANYRIDI